MRGQILDGRYFGTVFHDMPDHSLSYSGSPGLTRPADAPEHPAFRYTGRREPGVDRALDPIRNRHRPNMSAFAYQIHDGPVVVTALKMREVQFCRFFPPQAAPDEN